MNDHQKRRFASKIIQTLYNTVSGKKIAFLGWAFKKDTNDTRESAAIYVADHLLNEQANITVFDPQVKSANVYSDMNYLESRSSDKNEAQLSVSQDVYEACKNAHAIAIMTEWDMFRDLDWQKIYDNMLKPAFVFDGRNVLDNNKMTAIGFVYSGIGS